MVLQPLVVPIVGLAVALPFGNGCSVGEMIWRGLIAARFRSRWPWWAGVAVPAWVWLVPLVFAAAGVPAQCLARCAWCSPRRATLEGAACPGPLAPAARVLDAGCGLGDGSCPLALRAAYPQVALDGIEWELAAARGQRVALPWARVRWADMWKTDWSGYQMRCKIWFQRPESTARAAAKAQAEMAPAPGW